MAEVQRELRKKKKASKKAAGNGTEPEKPVRGSGVERLKKAADRQVARKSSELAELLMNKALEGKVESARLLVTLAEKKKPQDKPQKKRHGVKLIDLLESEPEWVEPEVGDVWVGNGWKKQGTGEIVREGEAREEEVAGKRVCGSANRRDA